MPGLNISEIYFSMQFETITRRMLKKPKRVRELMDFIE